MALYWQWRFPRNADGTPKSFEAARVGWLERVTWICGAETVLVEDTLDLLVAERWRLYQPQVMRMTAGSDSAADIWAVANQYPLDENAQRLVIVREAQRLVNWDPLVSWVDSVRTLPNNSLIMVSSEDDYPLEPTKYGDRSRPLKAHAQLIQRRGAIIKCSQATDTKTNKTNMTAESKIIEWINWRCPMREETARYLAVRTSGRMDLIRDVCDKVALWNQPNIGIEVIDDLCPVEPAESFADALTMRNRPAALLALRSVPEADYGFIVGNLEYRLTLLTSLLKLKTSGKDAWQNSANRAVPEVFRVKFGDYVKFYNDGQVRESRNALALADEMLRSGAREGVMEVLAMAF